MIPKKSLPPTVGQCPTLAQCEAQLASVYNAVMMSLQRNGVDLVTTTALGRILSRITETPQTPAEMSLIVSEEAKKMHEDIKMYLLKSSVTSSLPN